MDVVAMGENFGGEYTLESFEDQAFYLAHNVSCEVVKAMAIRFCGSNESDSQFTMVEKIYLFLKNIYSRWEQEAQQMEIDADLNQMADSVLCDWRIEAMILCLETAEELNELVQCSICLEDSIQKISTITTNCQHTYCKECICSHLDKKRELEQEPSCPLCRSTITTLELKDVDFYEEIYTKYSQPSAVRDHSAAFLDSFELFPVELFP
jgi:hypothetical protein